ncbi:putative polysaccharide biosynthesis protein [Haloplasma contractile]|uniref:Export protein for polysaccharide n=1 Tax=Haloplasma contractile SSD-17B TaxID=1033810 RepID=F7Q1D9_9MOLU|nr:polysaccharide biosynthesis protein [Haloplasma contractile]ERJ12858.1 Export protein for polysaccharide [Haloplasma contractile SSD-17B]
MSDRTFVRGAFIMSLGLILTKLLGLVFVFPFASLVGQEGQALYSYAYVPYVIFIDLATLGVPMGVAKFVSIYNAKGDYETSYRTYRRAVFLMFIIGTVMCVTLVQLSNWYSYRVLGGQQELTNRVSDISFVIQIIALALIFIPIVSVMRGFFQGFQNMVPSTVSQIVEQFVRVVFILTSSYIVIRIMDGTYVEAVAYAVGAASISGIASFIVLLRYRKKFNKQLQSLLKHSRKSTNKSGFRLLLELFKYAIPFAFFGLYTASYQLIDTFTFNKAYLIRGIENPELIYGTYAFEIHKLIMIPVTLAIAFSASLMPSVSSAYTLGHNEEVRKNISLSLEIIFFIVVPIVFMMIIFPNEIYDLLYDRTNLYGPSILLAYAPITILISINHLSTSIVQGVNQQRHLFKSLLAGILTKSLLNYFFIIWLGYSGAILATSAGYMISILFNFRIITKKIGFTYTYLVRRFLMIIVTSAITACILIVLNYILIDYEFFIQTKVRLFFLLSINTIIGALIYIGLSLYFCILQAILGTEITLERVATAIKNFGLFS